MGFFLIEPEVAGGFGDGTIFEDVRARPPRFSKFDYEFTVWLGDPILETIGCFIVTDALRKKLEENCASGISFGPVEISRSDIFDEFYPNLLLPKFVWMKVHGESGRDDFWLSEKCILVVSERMLSVLKEAGMAHGDVSEYRA